MGFKSKKDSRRVSESTFNKWLRKTVKSTRTATLDRSKPTTGLTNMYFNKLKGIEMSFFEEANEIFKNKHLKKIAQTGSDLINAVQPFIEKPTWWNAGRVAFDIGKKFVEDAEMSSYSFFEESNDWENPFSRDFSYTILQCLSGLPSQSMKTDEPTVLIKIVEVDDVKIGFSYNSKLDTCGEVYVESDKLDRAKEVIKKLLWLHLEGKQIVMRTKKNTIKNEASTVFEADDSFNPMPSARATQYSTYLKRCIAANVSRSIMFYGPPGTGKSTLARSIIANMDLRAFRIRIEDVGRIDNSTMFEAIGIFKPDVVIFDDLDRAHDQDGLLETLEFFQHNVKIVMATVNDRNELDEALLRPGRFDEMVEVDKMDEEVVRHVLGSCSDGFDVVKDWPIAFIQEYVKRRRFMSTEEAAAATVELAERVERLSKYRDDGDVDRMMKVNKKRSRNEEEVDDEINDGLFEDP